MRESELEQLLFRRVRQAGGIAVKLAPIVQGTPDRLVIMPGARMYLVELKAQGGTVSPSQKLWHERCTAKTGVPVTVLWGKDEINAWVEAHILEDHPNGLGHLVAQVQDVG